VRVPCSEPARKAFLGTARPAGEFLAFRCRANRFDLTESRGHLLRWLAAASLLAGLAYRIGVSGPLTLAAPRSAVSLTQPAMEGFLLFLQRVARRVPEGASVAVVARDSGNPVLFPAMRRDLYLDRSRTLERSHAPCHALAR
jgi:hypothetical protein